MELHLVGGLGCATIRRYIENIATRRGVETACPAQTSSPHVPADLNSVRAAQDIE
jgi:hypothetical protein